MKIVTGDLFCVMLCVQKL